MSKPQAFRNFPTSLPVTYGPYRAVVDRVFDGDTFLAFVDLGMGEYPPKEIRLLGANAPDRGEPGREEAKAFLESLLPRDTPLLLRTEKLGHDFDPTFSRWAAGVRMADGRDLSSVMVESGHARWI